MKWAMRSRTASRPSIADNDHSSLTRASCGCRVWLPTDAWRIAPRLHRAGPQTVCRPVPRAPCLETRRHARRDQRWTSGRCQPRKGFSCPCSNWTPMVPGKHTGATRCGSPGRGHQRAKQGRGRTVLSGNHGLAKTAIHGFPRTGVRETIKCPAPETIKCPPETSARKNRIPPKKQVPKCSSPGTTDCPP